MRTRTLLLVAALLTFPVQSRGQDKTTVEPFNIGESVTFSSTVLNETRLINVYLPQSYAADDTRKYPVIYLLDGSRDEDFIHVAGIVQFGSFSWINMIPETLVIGIANVNRRRDFTYLADDEEIRTEFPDSGGSAKFIKFIEEELQPFVEKRYRTTAPRTLIGQSLGGLLATEILMKKPDLFDNYVIVSPSLWWDDESLLKATPQSDSAEKTVYVAVGKEGPIMERAARELHDKVKASEHTRTFFKLFEERDHGDTLHLAVYDSFEKIFHSADRERQP